jgi:hypothetical protein
MRDFISVVPFFACKAPGCSHPGERNRHLHLIRSTEFGTSPVLTTDLVFGFVIVAYSMLLLELSEKLKRTVDRPGMEADSGG